MNWNSELSGVNRSVSADALTEAMRNEEEEERGRMVTVADELTAASDSELPTAIGRAMNGGGGGGGVDAARRVLVVGLLGSI